MGGLGQSLFLNTRSAPDLKKTYVLWFNFILGLNFIFFYVFFFFGGGGWGGGGGGGVGGW